MNRKIVLGLSIFLVLALIGCTDISNGSISSSASPSDVVKAYFEDMITYSSDHKIMYNLLSDSAKPNDFDKWSDYINNVNYGMSMSSVDYQYVGTQNEQITENRATVQIKCKMIRMGGFVNTLTGNVELIKEGGSWKLSKDMRLSSGTCLTEAK